ncbi:hypothetical protein [Kocuria sp. CPCC 205263]|uniref:hypothetical protein n=1 Tax=Kocuria sp. CPCC 205263 TaxID=3073555 RepID=UPI0034D6535E
MTATAQRRTRFQAMAQAEVAMSVHGFLRPDPLNPLAEAEHQLLVDVAAEVGPALRLPAGTDGSPRGGTAGHAAVLEWTSPGGLVHRTAPEHTVADTAPDRRSAPATGRPPGNPPPVGPAADPPPGDLRLDDLPSDAPGRSETGEPASS